MLCNAQSFVIYVFKKKRRKQLCDYENSIARSEYKLLIISVAVIKDCDFFFFFYPFYHHYYFYYYLIFIYNACF